MCMLLYMGSACELAERSTPHLRVEAVGAPQAAVSRWFSLPLVRFIGAHTGCSCGFPHVIGDEPAEFYPGMLDLFDPADLRSAESLLEVLRDVVTQETIVELLPVREGDEGTPPKGVVTWWIDEMSAERLVLSEGFLHVVRRGAR